MSSKGRKHRVRAQRREKSSIEVLEPRQLLANSFGSTETDVYWDESDAGYWVQSPITISDAPAGSVATSVNITWKVDARDLTTADYRLAGPGGYASSTYTNLPWTSTDVFSGFAQTSESSQTITLPANAAVNGTWSFGILESDDWTGLGRIDSWSITITYTTPAPEIQVAGNGYNIVDGDTTPSTTDNTNYGTAAVGGAGISKTFVVSNTGTAALTLGSVSVPTGYSITQNLPTSIAAGSSANLIVALNTATAGVFYGNISFATNDADENPFNFRITGAVLASAPEIQVTGNSYNIADGDTTPSTTDNTNFGTATLGGSSISRTFVVNNIGTPALTLGSVSIPTGYSITQNLPTSIAAGSSANLIVTLNTTTAGTFFGDISFATNDSDENPFNFGITGTVQGPEIRVTGNSVDIVDGDITPSATDNTSFGTATQAGAAISRTFAVSNTGAGVLTLGSVSVPTGYIVTQNLPSSIAAGGSADLIVTLDTTTVGTFFGDISFATNDSSENPFNFRITGTVQANGPEIRVAGNGFDIVDGDTTPIATDLTNFGTAVIGGTAIARTFYVSNSGTEELTLGSVSVPAGYTITQNLPSSIAAGGNAGLTVRLVAATTGTFSGDISFATNDDDENPFNFRITGMVQEPPEIRVTGNGVDIVDGDNTPSTTDNTDFGAAVVGGPAISKTFVISNTGTGPLTLGAVAVPSPFSITQNLPGSIAAGASANLIVALNTTTLATFIGYISFATNDPDENPFNFDIKGAVQSGAPTNITLSATAIPENQPAGTTVGTFATTDPTPGDTFTYALVSGTGSTDNASFQIVANELRSNGQLNFESKQSYSIRVRTTDQSFRSYEKTFPISVTDVNEALTDVALSCTGVNEGQPPGTTVGLFTTTDPDLNDAFNYALIGGAGADDNASFTITGNALNTAAIFSATAKSSYSIRARATDVGGAWVERTFGITVTADGVPTMVWSSYLGGDNTDSVSSVAVDANGDAWVTGTAYSSGWVSGGFDTSYNGGSSDAFVAKINANGTLAWSSYLGGSDMDSGYGIALDANGDAWVTGSTNSPGWASGGFDTSFNGGTNAFVVKINADGTLAWASYMGVNSNGTGVALDASGNAWVAGHTSSSGWTSGGFDTSYNGGPYDAFVAKINANGTLAWSSYLGGSVDDLGRKIVLNAGGDAWVVGSTKSSGWTNGGFDTSYNGGQYDAFVAKINANGTLAWSSYLGGSDMDLGYGIALDANGHAWMTGGTYSSGWTNGGFDISYTGNENAYVAKINANGTLAWSSYLGETSSGSDIALDASGNALVMGSTFSSGWTSGGFDTSFGGGADCFVAKVNANGTLAWSSYLGGDDTDYGYGIELDASGNVWLTGMTLSSGWTGGGFDTSHNGGTDGLVAKIRLNHAPNALNLSSSAIVENRPAGTPVGTFSTTDSDSGESFTYALVSGTGSTDNGSFQIVSNELRSAATFNYESKSSYSIRVRTTDQAGLVFEKAFTITISKPDEVAPAISTVSINNGTAQRSMVKTLTVVFSEPVTLADGALSVLRTTGASVPNMTVTPANPLGDQKTWELTFSGIGAVGYSLPDGLYNLVASAAGVHDLAGNALTANYSSSFHRLFGDFDGDRDVDNTDLNQFKRALNRPSNYSAFWYFDFDGNGTITNTDHLELKSRMTRRLLR